MAINVRAGSVVRLRASVRLRDTLQVVAGLPVFLDRQDQAAGPWTQIAGGQTDASGDVQAIDVTITIDSLDQA